MKKWYLVTLLLIISCNDEEKTIAPKAAKEVFAIQTQKILAQDFQEFQKFYAQSFGIKQTQLISYSGGEVKSVRVKDGSRVKKGQTLCSIDAGLAQTQYEMAQVSVSLQEKEWERKKAHFEQKIGSETEVSAAHMQYLQAKQNLLTASKNRKGAFCTAPFSGIVANHSIEPFQNVAPNSPTLSLIDDRTIRLTFGIPENAVSGFANGNQVIVNDTLKAKIYSIAQTLDPKTRTYQAEARIANPKKALRIGKLFEIKALRRSFENALVIPSAAIIPLSKKNVIMLEEDGKAYSKEVHILASNSMSSVISGDVSEGASLIVKGHGKVSNGSLVKVSQK